MKKRDESGTCLQQQTWWCGVDDEGLRMEVCREERKKLKMAEQ